MIEDTPNSEEQQTQAWRKRMQASSFAKPRGPLGWVAGQLMARLSTQRSEWGLSLLDLQPDEQLLEVGFGPGVDIQRAARVVTGGTVVGVDPSATMVSLAGRRNRADIRAGKVELHQVAMPGPLPFPDAVFTTIFTNNSFAFWDAPDASLRELKRVLRPGGRIAIVAQPLWLKTPAEARVYGETVAQALRKAGFSRVRLEARAMKPVDAVAALGELERA
ncbi:MAG: class I SAM-dependent methyltransferase [Ktedonobacterales bacterium]